MKRDPIKRGDEVKDPVTGFSGIAVVRHQYLEGCDRITIQPPMKKGDVKVPDCWDFDEPTLSIVKRGKIKRSAPDVNPGGPDKYVSKNRC